VGYEEKKLIQAHLTLSCLTFVISEVVGCHAILAEKDGRYAMQCTKIFNVEIDRAGTRFLPTSHIDNHSQGCPLRIKWLNRTEAVDKLKKNCFVPC
jgi:hypothetical protein